MSSAPGQPGGRDEPARSLLFGEELAEEPPLAQLLAELQGRLGELRARYGPVLPPGEQLELLDAALDELERALDRVRAARTALARLELRLVSMHTSGLARMRRLEKAEPASVDAV